MSIDSHRLPRLERDPIRALHVDDEIDFAESIGRELADVDDVLEIDVAKTPSTTALDAVDCLVCNLGAEGIENVIETAVSRGLPLISVSPDGSDGLDEFEQGAELVAHLDKRLVESNPTRLAVAITEAATRHRLRQHDPDEMARFRTIIEHAHDLFIVVDTDGKLRYVSPSIDYLLGYDPSTIEGDPIDELVHPADRDIVTEAADRSCSSPGDAVTLEFRVNHRDGSWRWLEAKGRNLLDDPAIEGILVTARDVSERQEYRDALEAQLAALEASTDGIAILDEDGSFEYANEALAERHGYDDPAELIGQSWRHMYDGEQRARIDEEVRPALETHGHWHGSLTGSSGEMEPFEQDLAITMLDDGRLSFVIRDITSQAEYEHALEGLHEASTELMATTHEIEVHQRVVEAAESILDFHVCCVLGHENGMLVPKAVSSGAPPDGVRPMEPDEGLAGRAFQTGEATRTVDVTESQQARPARAEYRSGITVPIGEYGVFQAIADEPDHFSQRDVDLTGVLASYANAVLDRIDSERDRQREHDRLRRLFENTTECIVEVTFDDDDQPIIHAINDAFEETFGVDPDEVVGTYLDDIIVPDEDRANAQAINRRIVKGEVVHRELERQTPEGRRTFLLRTAPFTLDGEPRAYAIYLDISERKRQEERFQTLIEHSTDMITLLDADGTFLYQSPAVERHLGYDTEELIGENAFEYVHPDDLDRVIERFNEGVNDPTALPNVEYRFMHADGSWRWLESLGNNQLDHPAIEAFVVNSRDITERRQREQELRRQNERLERVSSVISHDLRNPLTVADGYLDIAMEASDLDELEPVQEALDRMETIINDTLTLARHGHTIGEFETIEVHQLGRICWGTVSTKGGDLEVVDEFTIRGDTDRVRQVLENLFRNAVKYAGTSVTVEVGTLDGDGFYVEDDGPGIDPEVREDVFEPGYTTSSESTGFGLAIVKEIVEAHGWTIEIIEGAEGGARFEVTGVELVEDT